MSRPGLDTHPLKLGPGWFNDLFAEIGIDAEVKSLTSKSIGTGQIGENVRFVFNYARAGANAPKTLVGKFPPPTKRASPPPSCSITTSAK